MSKISRWIFNQLIFNAGYACTRKSNEDMEHSAKQRESNQLKSFISVQSVVAIYFLKVYEASHETHVP